MSFFVALYITIYHQKMFGRIKHTKISSEEISGGREYLLLFLCVKVEVSCEVVASFGARRRKKTGKTPVLDGILSRYVGR